MRPLDIEVRIFVSAARWTARVVSRVPTSSYASPGLGEWDIRSLIGHTSRALLTVEQYLQTPATEIEVEGPAAYFERAGQLAGSAPDAVRQRGVDAGVALGPDVPREFAHITERVVGGLDASSDPAIMTAVGGMRLSDYLPTRTFELVVHGLDIARAADLDADPPEAPLHHALGLANELATRAGEGAAVLMTLTGRERLPPGFSVLP